MMPGPGTLAVSDLDRIVLAIGGRRHLVALDDVRSLMVFGRVVPVVRESCRSGRSDTDEHVVAIESYAAITWSGEALKIFTRKGSFIVPLASVQRVFFPTFPTGPTSCRDRRVNEDRNSPFFHEAPQSGPTHREAGGAVNTGGRGRPRYRIPPG